MSETKSFWTTLPGILSGIAGVITAIGGLLAILYSIGVLGPSEANKPTGVVREPPRIVSEDVGGKTSLVIKNLENEISELEMTIEMVEKKLAGGSQPSGSLNELQSLKEEREKRLMEIENSQVALKFELEQLQLHASGNQEVQRKIEQIEGESIPDLEAERSVVQGQVQELKEMIFEAENKSTAKGELELLRKKKQNLQEEMEQLKSQMQPTR
ncbi:MAG: hypothetical protein KKH60_04510 [Proteobacteria bacterium]|nr:hypothetical protein [Pseudomonadota bacterium]MBU1137423.1 hypothetical protein [Pseudomonadota bacterium]